MTEEDSFESPALVERTAIHPTARTWVKHLILLLMHSLHRNDRRRALSFWKQCKFYRGRPRRTAGEAWTFFQTLPVAYAVMIYKTVTDLFVVDGLLFEGLSFSVSLLLHPNLARDGSLYRVSDL